MLEESQWNTHEWKVDVKDVEIISKFEEGAVTLWQVKC